MIRPTTFALLTAATLVLAGCESDEDRAEGYYQSALALMEEGDVDRALVELRNVFEHDGFHREARRLYADTLMEQGDITAAYGQYQRFIEQYPDTLEVRLILVDIALAGNQFAEVERHGRAARDLAPDDPRVRAITSIIRFNDAQQAENEERVAEAVAMARSVLEELPDNLLARRVVIISEITSDSPEEALDDIDIALALDPGAYQLHEFKLGILEYLGQAEEFEIALEEMYLQFPEVEEVFAILTEWHQQNGNLERVAEIYRDAAGEDTGPAEGHLEVVEFLETRVGREASFAELDRLIAANSGTQNAALYQATKANLIYERGDPNGAIEDVQAILDGVEPSDASSDQTQQVKVILARMLTLEGNSVGARTLVEEVLAVDSSNVDALKLRAAWLIDEDKYQQAVVDLRTALAEAPQDTDVLNLMSIAQQRLGNLQLAGQRLALAVEVSGQAPLESLRYAEFLMGQGQLGVAETVLVAARAASPGNLSVLQALVGLWLRMENWDQLERLQADLQAFDSPLARDLDGQIETRKLLAQNQTDAGLALLEDQLESFDNPLAAVAVLVNANIRAGKLDEARDVLAPALAENPDIEIFRLLDANLLILEQDMERAEEVLQGIIADGAESDVAARFLFVILRSQGRLDEARSVLEQAIEDYPSSGNLLWMLAGIFEQEGNLEGAIEIYEIIYAGNPGNTVIANNLASLLSVHRTSEEDLERAFTIAQRLRGLNQPAFQDTYGWIEYRRGNYEAALASLAPAAEGLPNNALVQAHLGLTLVALEREAEARPVLERALELSGGQEHPQFDRARAALEALDAE